jgi:hypothetical protein
LPLGSQPFGAVAVPHGNREHPLRLPRRLGLEGYLRRPGFLDNSICTKPRQYVSVADFNLWSTL